MPRPKKKKIDLTKDSLSNLLQEIYNECVEQRTVALNQRNKLLKEIEELQDAALVGKVTTDLLKVVDSAIDKKLALAKLQAGLINNGESGQVDTSSISQEQMKFLREVINEKNAEGIEDGK